MDLKHISEYGIAIVIAVIILREVFGFILKQRDSEKKAKEDSVYTQQHYMLSSIEHHIMEMSNRLKSISEVLDKAYSTIDSVYQMHNVRDNEGVPVWYKGVDKAMINELTKELKSLSDQVTDVKNRVNGLKDTIKDMK